MNDVKQMAGQEMRNLLSLGLRYSIVGDNKELMKSILAYSKGIKQILHINVNSVSQIIEKEDTESMLALVNGLVLIRLSSKIYDINDLI